MTYQTKLIDPLNLAKLRLRLHGIGYVQIRLGSDPLWYGFTLFTRDRFETGMVRFHMGSPSQVDSFGTRLQIRFVPDPAGPV